MDYNGSRTRCRYFRISYQESRNAAGEVPKFRCHRASLNFLNSSLKSGTNHAARERAPRIFITLAADVAYDLIEIQISTL